MTLYAKIDVALQRDPDLVGLPLARLIYIQAVCYCRENLTDGQIDRRVLPLIAVDIPQAAKHMNALVTAGKLGVTCAGWRIPERIWKRFNPTKVEVDELRRAEAERKQAWRDKRRRDGIVPLGHQEAS